MALELGRVLITGASGFMGRHLIDFFDEQWVEYVRFQWDLLDKESIHAFFSKEKCTQIIHLVGTFEGELEKQISLNFMTTANLLEVADIYGVRKVIFASSWAVYGEPIDAISYETDVLSPNTLYGLSKKFAEDIILYYSRSRDFTSIILRFPNVYGEWSRGVIPSFLQSIREKGRIILYGDGTQSRNFLHVSDAVRAFYLSLSQDTSDIYNITNPIKTSLNELIELLSTHLQFDVEKLPQTSNNLRDLLLSSERARLWLGFEALQKTILID